MTLEKCKDLLNALPAHIKENMKLNIGEECISYEYFGKMSEIKCDEIESQINEKLKYDKDKYVLLSDHYYEVMITCDNRRNGFRSIPDLESQETKDNVSDILYNISRASLQFRLEFMDNFNGGMGFLRRPIGLRGIRKNDEVEDSNTFSDLLNDFYRLPLTLKVECSKKKTLEEFEVLCNSYLFNIAYNLGVVYKPVGSQDDILPERIRRSNNRTGRLDEIDPPKLKYKKELIDQYNMGLSSNYPFIEFLCYFHIMEYFFDDVYKEELVKNVQNEIMSPKFSAKRQKDIVKLIGIIQKKIKNNNIEFQVNEQEALELTLRRFIPLEELKDNITDFDATLLSYYHENKVKFSNGDEFDLVDSNNDKLYKKMALRIYKTRNAIVHSKSNDLRDKERGVYTPFMDEPILAKEIPLMRIIAEIIMITSADVL